MPIITISGNATSDPELQTHNGKQVVNLTVAVNSRIKQNEEWVDGPVTFYRVAVWQTGPRDTQPQNVAQSVTKGQQVLVTGELKPREFEHNGEKRMSLDISAHEIGVGLRFKPVGGGGVAQAAPQHDPWGSTPATSVPF